MKDFTDLLTFKIMQTAINDYGDINLLKLSQFCNTTNTGLNLVFAGKRKWNAETWLTVLCALNAVELKSDKIVIHTKNHPGLKLLTDKLPKEDFGERRRYYAP